MYDLSQMFILGLIIGFTGALAPGPTLVAKIHSSLSGGWTSGPKIMLGHMVAETVIFLIVLGLAAIALIGGISLILFGVLTITGMKHATIQNPGAQAVGNPYLAGLVTSAANPYFWIWWLTIGSAMVISGHGGRPCACRGLYGWTLTGARTSFGTRWYQQEFPGAGRFCQTRPTGGSWVHAGSFLCCLGRITSPACSCRTNLGTFGRHAMNGRS